MKSKPTVARAVKAVLDSSVLVSAFLKPNSLPGAVVRAGIAGRYDLCLSLGILAETARILRDKPRLRQRYSYTDEARLCAFMRRSRRGRSSG